MGHQTTSYLLTSSSAGERGMPQTVSPCKPHITTKYIITQTTSYSVRQEYV